MNDEETPHVHLTIEEAEAVTMTVGFSRSRVSEGEEIEREQPFTTQESGWQPVARWA